MMRVVKFIVLSGALLVLGSSLLHYYNERGKEGSQEMVSLLAKAGNTYMGPKHPVTGNPQLVRVEVLMRDSNDAGGPQLNVVEFDNRSIPLKPRDIYGNRGSASFQVPPGKYKLRWTVNIDHYAWPRNAVHEEEVVISPRDLWIQLAIEGDTASIT